MATHPPIVLVVDDDPDILDALAEILEVEGYEVRRAKNGQDAIGQLGPTAPNLILLDLMMPVMDGFEFARYLKKSPQAKVPVIVLSADRNVNTKAKELGAAAHLAKPFDLNDLLDLVRQVLKQPAA